MLYFIRPSLEVVKEGRIFLTKKMSWKLFLHLPEHHQTNNDDLIYAMQIKICQDLFLHLKIDHKVNHYRAIH